MNYVTLVDEVKKGMHIKRFWLNIKDAVWLTRGLKGWYTSFGIMSTAKCL